MKTTLISALSILTLTASIPSFAAETVTISENISEFFCYNLEEDLLIKSLNKVGIEAYNVRCDSDTQLLTAEVVYNVKDIPTNIKTEILVNNPEGYPDHDFVPNNVALNKIVSSLGYKATFSPVIVKGKSHLASRIWAEINPSNIPGALFPGYWEFKEGRQDEKDKIVGCDVTLVRIRNN